MGFSLSTDLLPALDVPLGEREPALEEEWSQKLVAEARGAKYPPGCARVVVVTWTHLEIMPSLALQTHVLAAQ